MNICTHFGENEIGSYKPITPPIVQTSTFSFDSYEQFLDICNDEKNSYMYTRGTNPTTQLLEKRLAQLEGGEGCKVFSSGMAAISSTLLTLLQNGDHVISLNIIYGQATTFMNSLSKYGIEHTNVFVKSMEDIEDNIQENTKIIYMESPSSQLMELLDLEAITKIAKEKNIITVIDNTWATPIFQKPIKHGVDVVIHSCSKYIGGNSDVVSGAVISTNKIIDEIFDFAHQNLGAVNSPFNSWLLLRGLRTLPMRLNYQQQSVKKVINFLQQDDRIEIVNHPFCGNKRQKELANKYLLGYASLLSFVIKENDFDKLKKFVNSLKLFQIGVSWGGYESLVLPAFKGINQEQLEKRKMSKMHVRLYVGIEDADSLIEDLKQALDSIYNS
ncbi:aminotransferase class I/II-fold pyridoxal phosphate-dependent enzyme [Clostridioides sp. ZZV15-6598]|nr:aminotransferase class I/II-fold pyridoxal phosphate-dependent enzyme [Clostridioides sp. ZZV15-6598]